jgi:hypothetical protein
LVGIVQTSSVFIEGRAATLLGSGEAAWCETVRARRVALPAELRLRFVVDSWRRGGHLFDLDNLVDPVLQSASWPGEGFVSVWATVDVGEPIGVHVETGPLPALPADAVAAELLNPRVRSVRAAVADPGFDCFEVFSGDEPLGCELALGQDVAPIRFSFESPVKPAIDALWPVIGGRHDRPNDHRIRDLRVRLQAGNGIRLALWRLTP